MFKLIRPILMILPILLFFLAFSSNEQKSKANTNGLSNRNLATNQLIKLSDDSWVNQEDKANNKPVNVGFGLKFHNNFGVQIDDCYYQIEQVFDAQTGELDCGTLIIFCKDSVEIYTGGSNCS